MLSLGIGAGVGILIFILAKFLKFSLDKSFYPTILIIISTYYFLFAIMAGQIGQTIEEIIGFFAFLIIAIIGYKKPIWVAFGLALHGVFDIFHQKIIDNDGTPIWWPSFCYSIDFTIAILLFFSLKKNSKTMA